MSGGPEDQLRAPFEQLLTALAVDRRKLLFPEACDERFANDAPAVTFGLLMARAKDIRLATGFNEFASALTDSKRLFILPGRLW